MRPTIRLCAGPLSAEIVPTLGGGVAHFDLERQGRTVEIFRSWPETGTDDPNQLGAYVLVPWSNRISGSGFTFGAIFYPVAPNFDGEPCPIHGNGWISPWRVCSIDQRCVRLEHEASEVGPYRYESILDYQLDSKGMLVRLEVKNKAPMPLPYGLGIHPWLPRTPQTRLIAPASSVWLEDSLHLPTERIAISNLPELDFSSFRLLPKKWVNNCFVDWNGFATILWEDRGLALHIEANSILNSYILYSPSMSSPFFCFEPVSHSVDAHHLSPGPESHGLKVLKTGATLAAQCRFNVREIGQG
ncbi:MAG: aldose 1-epimerase [Verrucomicrobia bacterium]|nr:aldose 1-epimerase [Verrucomicrobiota bacterium]